MLMENESDKIEVIDFGLRDYKDVLTMQQNLFEQLVNEKITNKKGKEYLLIGEHFPVITLGRRANEKNILISEEILKNNGIDIYHIGRGGDVTYHCPGQLIVYPILDLTRHRLGVKDYVDFLEETVIRLIKRYKIKGEKVEGATGVWIEKGAKEERKICAIGIKCSHFCTMHGLALNVTSDLSGFSFINPCGFHDKGVTSMERETSITFEEGKELDMKKIKKEFTEIFLNLITPN